MELYCYGSSSSGNMFALISSTGKALVLDAGLNPKQLFKKVLPSDIQGVLVTHQHGDHASCINRFLTRFAAVYAPFSAEGINRLEDGIEARIGDFRIIPMRMNHDVICFGYLIMHSELSAPVLYATDTNGIPYLFDSLSVCIIEADYDSGILKHNYENGEIDNVRVNRIMKTHNSIEQAANFVKENVAYVEKVVLCHLSSQNSDIEHFKTIFKTVTGIDAEIASAGYKLKIEKYEIFRKD